MLELKIFAGFFVAMAENWKNLKGTTAFSLFLVCPNRSALVRELLSYKSRFVSQW